MKTRKYILLVVSIVAIISTIILYFTFPNPTFILSDDGEVLKQDYRWVIHVVHSIAIGIFFGVLASITVSKKSMDRFEKVAISGAAILAGGLVFVTKIYTYYLNNVTCWPWEYLLMFTVIAVTACLITAFSFKGLSYFPSEHELSIDTDQEEGGKVHTNISFETRSDENEIVNMRFMYDKFIQNLKTNTDDANIDYDFDIKDKYKLLDDQTIVFVKNGESANQYIIFRKKDNELFIDEFFSVEDDTEMIDLVLEKFISEQGMTKVTIHLPDYEKVKSDLIAFVGKHSDYNYVCNDKEVSFEVR